MKSRCVRPCAKREKETKQTGKRIDYGRFCWLETRPLHFSRTESGQLKVTLSARKDVPLNKTNMLGTIKCFRFDERPRKKQDFGVAEHAARGRNKTSALPSMARPPLMWKWREYRIIRIGPIEATAKHHKPFPFPQIAKGAAAQRASRW